MASSSHEAHSQPKRPAALARQSSTSSYVSQSPSDSHSSSHRAPHKPHKQHVVGHGRMPRNTSVGKNLNKLNKLTQAHGGDGASNTKHHRRSHSGNSTPVASSPRPGMKRNASTVGVVRHTSHTQVAIRKNHSSGHLSRQNSSKTVLKPTKSDIAPPKRSLAHPGRSRHNSPDAHPTVHFDIGDEEGPEDAWTEESASQSPNTTRSNTRQNSVILDPHKPARTSEMEDGAAKPSQPLTEHPQPQTPPSSLPHPQPNRAQAMRQPNGNASNQHSRPPDADMITSRLLQRNSSHNPPPQTSSISATVMSDAHDARSLSHSQGSTLMDTPGRDLVSRFMDGGSSGGTPRDSNFLPSRASPRTSPGGDLDKAKRNKSAPNMAEAMGGSTSRSHSRRSGTTTPNAPQPDVALPPSRTAQKLLLQRASSHIEPAKLIPVTLPRTGGPVFIQSAMTYPASDGRIDPRLKQQFEHVNQEYKVVRRYRHPLSDAIVRLDYTPGTSRKPRAASRAATVNGSTHAHLGDSASARSSFHEGTAGDGTNEPTRRSRYSFEVGRDGATEERRSRHSFESDTGRTRNEAEEICRRLWDSVEVAESD